MNPYEQGKLNARLFSAIAQGKEEEVAEHLKNGAKVCARHTVEGDVTSPLALATHLGHDAIRRQLTQALLEHDYPEKAAQFLNYGLHTAIEKDEAGSLAELLAAAKTMGFSSKAYYQLMRHAAMHGSCSATAVLLEFGVSTRSGEWEQDLGSSFSPPLDLALKKGWFSCARLLVEANAPVTPYASQHCSSCVSSWVEGFGFGPDASPQAALELLALMVSRGAVVNGQDHLSGKSPLGLAFSPPKPEAVAMLLHYGADPAAPVHGDRTVSFSEKLAHNPGLHPAFSEGAARVQQLVLEASVASVSETPRPRL